MEYKEPKVFICKSCGGKGSEAVKREELIEVVKLFGVPRCVNLHHQKKYQHGSFDHCPVEEKILSIINKSKV